MPWISDTAHLHAPEATEGEIARSYCPTCAKSRFMARWFTPWYGWDMTCLKCGESWQDGERCERPFMPKWRQKSVAGALARWRRGAQGTAAMNEAGVISTGGQSLGEPFRSEGEQR